MYSIGIDFGMSSCSICLWEDNEYTLIPDFQGNVYIPSKISIDKNETILVGNEATEPCICDLKRLIVCSGEQIKSCPYEIIKKSENSVAIKINNKLYLIEELCGYIFIKLKSYLEVYLNDKISDIVLTVPAHYTDLQKRRISYSAQIAGFKVTRLIHEPTAVALAYGLLSNDESNNNEKIILIYDFGAGTLNITVASIFGDTIEILGISGNQFLGGRDFDTTLVKWLETQIKCIPKNIKQYAEKIKIHLSKELYFNDPELNINITRDQFNEICKDLYSKALAPVNEILLSTHKQLNEIDHIILTGGTTQIPYIHNMLQNLFKKNLDNRLDPFYTVAIGASIQAHLINNTCINNKSLILLEKTSLSLGVEVMNELMSVIIPKETAIPCTITKIYTNNSDFDTEINIRIFEGEREFTKDNFFIGSLLITNVNPLPKGYCKFEVTFHIDMNKLLEVSVINIQSDKKVTSTFVNYDLQLSKEEIEHIQENANKMRDADIIRKNKKQLFLTLVDLYNYIINLSKELCIEIPNEPTIEALIKENYDVVDNEELNKYILLLRTKYEQILSYQSLDVNEQENTENVENIENNKKEIDVSEKQSDNVVIDDLIDYCNQLLEEIKDNNIKKQIGDIIVKLYTNSNINLDEVYTELATLNI